MRSLFSRFRGMGFERSLTPPQIPDPDTGFFGSELDFATAPDADYDEPEVIFEKMNAEIHALRAIVGVHADTFHAAKHLLDAMNMIAADGRPVFAINGDIEDDASIETLRHAVIDLVSTIEGALPPAIAFPQRNLH